MVAKFLSTLCLIVTVCVDTISAKITMEELENGVSGHKITENKGNDIPSTAISLHKQARSKVSKDDYKGAIKTLRAAMKLAPRWESIYYDLAYTYFLQKDYVQALKYYITTDKLFNKGFFAAKTAIWSLNHELKTKQLPEGSYYDYLAIELIADKAKQLDSYIKITQSHPEYAPAWAKIATLSLDDEETQKAIDNGLKQMDTNIGIDSETKGILYIQQALIYSNNDENDKAKRTLADLVMSDDVTFNNQNIAKLFLKKLTKHKKSRRKRKNENKDKQDL